MKILQSFKDTHRLLIILLILLPFVSPAGAQVSQRKDACGPVDYYHQRINDRNGDLDSWKKDAEGPFHTIVGLNMRWWKNTPDVHGWPAYCTAAELKKDYGQYNGAVPMSTCPFGINACLKYYNYTGDTAFRTMAVRMGDYIVNQALYPDTFTAYPGFPVPVGETGDINPDGSGHPNNYAGEVMPDKGAMAGWALLKLYEVTGDVSYLKTALNIADVLARQAVEPDSLRSPWPFRADARTGEIIDGLLCGNQVFACRLYDELLRLGISGKGKYRKTRDMVWNWMKETVIPDTTGSKWQDFFEDHSGDEDNPTQIDAMETARYLLEKKEAADPDWFRLAGLCIQTTRDQWRVHLLKEDGYTTIGEQEMDMSSYNSHTARYGSVLAMYYECGADSFYRKDAYHSLCYAAYSVEDDGYTNTYYKEGRFAWTTDSFGDFVQHFMDAFAAVPEWAGNVSAHLLRTSSEITRIDYQPGLIRYSTFDPTGTEKIKLPSPPLSVQMDNKPITGFSWDESTGTLIMERKAGKDVMVAY